MRVVPAHSSVYPRRVGWTDTMYKVQDATGWQSFFFFATLTLFGSLFLLNLLVAGWYRAMAHI